jgi:hypothetical protein
MLKMLKRNPDPKHIMTLRNKESINDHINKKAFGAFQKLTSDAKHWFVMTTMSFNLSWISASLIINRSRVNPFLLKTFIGSSSPVLKFSLKLIVLIFFHDSKVS